jgi:hypothetical protein
MAKTLKKIPSIGYFWPFLTKNQGLEQLLTKKAGVSTGFLD